MEPNRINVIGKKPLPTLTNTINSSPVIKPKPKPPVPAVNAPQLGNPDPETIESLSGEILIPSHLTGQNQVRIVAKWLSGPKNPAFNDKMYRILLTRVGMSDYYHGMAPELQYNRLKSIKEQEFGCGCGGKQKAKLKFC